MLVTGGGSAKTYPMPRANPTSAAATSNRPRRRSVATIDRVSVTWLIMASPVP